MPLKETHLRLDIEQTLDDRKNGLFILNNEQVRYQHSCITGFNPEREAFSTFAMPDKALEISSQAFKTANFTFPDDKINILCSHENKFFTHKDILEEYSELYPQLNLILGGHLHDGYVPLLLQKYFLKQIKDKGIWEKIPPLIDQCRRAFIVDEKGISNVFTNITSDLISLHLKNNQTASVVVRAIAKYSWFLPSKFCYSYIELENKVVEPEKQIILKRTK